MVDSRVFLRNVGEVLNLFNLVTRLKILASIVESDVKPHMFASHNGISLLVHKNLGSIGTNVIYYNLCLGCHQGSTSK